MGIPTTFSEYFAGLLTHTAVWEHRNGLDIDGNEAYDAGVDVVGRLKSINVLEGGRIRFQDQHSPRLDPTAEFICAVSPLISAMDRLTFALIPAFPYVVDSVETFYDESSQPFYQKCTLKYETKTTDAP